MKDTNLKGNLKLLPLLACGGALFSMHFGASSMVWPMNWGKESGSSFLLAFMGAFITSLLLVVVGYIALAKSHTSFSKMCEKTMGKKIGLYYAFLAILVNGPLYVIPRMPAASWDSITQAFSLPDSKILMVIFIVVFHLIAYYFIINPGKTMDKISKILLPFLLIVVVLVVGKGILFPLSQEQLPKVYSESAFAYGFTNGYATGEILCALIFGAVIINSLKEKGVSENKITINMIYVGIVGVGILTITHFCHMYMGSYTTEVFPDLGYTSLYTAVASSLYGKWGGYLFTIALFFAALTTCIGMTSGCAEFFVDASDGKLNYKTTCIFILVLSTIFANLGLTNILGWLSPIMDGIYPAVIVLVIYYALIPKFDTQRKINACRWATYTALAFGLLDMIWKYLVRLNINPLNIVNIYLKIPFASVSLAWIPWVIVACVIGYLVNSKRFDN